MTTLQPVVETDSVSASPYSQSRRLETVVRTLVRVLLVPILREIS